MHEHLIKWVSEFIKKNRKRGATYMLALRRVVLVIQKFIMMPEKDGSWHGIKTDTLRITYSIFSILIPKLVLVFFTFAPTSFDDTNLIIARL